MKKYFGLNPESHSATDIALPDQAPICRWAWWWPWCEKLFKNM